MFINIYVFIHTVYLTIRKNIEKKTPLVHFPHTMPLHSYSDLTIITLTQHKSQVITRMLHARKQWQTLSRNLTEMLRFILILLYQFHLK